METTTQPHPTPRIFDFSDYRSFLSAYFKDRKKQNPAWSYQAWARLLGLKNNTSLLKILNGNREAGPEITQKLVEYFRFGSRERRYFEDLVRLSKSKTDPSLQVTLMEQLRKAHPKQEFELLDEKRFRAISEWWFYAIRQLAKHPEFNADPEWISERLEFKVQPRQIQQAIEVMKKLGLLIQDPKSLKWKSSPTGLNTTDDVASEALKRFHEGVLSILKESIRSVHVKEREISGITLLMSEREIPRAKEFLRKVEDDFASAFERASDGAERADRVYQLEIALVPLSKPISKTSVGKLQKTKVKKGPENETQSISL